MAETEPDRRLAEVQDKLERARPREKKDIMRAYYRESRNERERGGDERRYADRKDMR